MYCILITVIPDLSHVTFTSSAVFVSCIAFLLLLLGSFVIYKDPKKHVNQSFFSLTLSILFWTVSRFFEDVIDIEYWRHVFLLVDFSSGAFLAFSILLFCLDIVRFKWVVNVYARSLFFIIPSIIFLLVFLTPWILSGAIIDGNNIINPVYGPLGTLYDIVVAVVSLVGIGFIFWGLRKTKGGDKAPYAYSLIGIFISVITILATNVFFVDLIATSPSANIYGLLGTFSPIFIVLFPGYAILRYRLFNAKVLATETLSFIILLGTFLQIFLAESLYQVVMRCLIFIAMFLSMGLLAKMVDREVRSKEELQVLSQELAEANQELKRLDAAKSEFISIASHQLRTPLTAIRGYISLVLEGSYGKVTPTLQDVLNKVYVVNNRMGQLVEDLLSISRIESGRVQYNLVATQLEPMVADLVDMFSIMAKSKGLSLKMKLPKKSLPKLMIDATKMREVISNLIDNALKYTKEGGVTVTVEGDDRYVAVRVQDTGIGVDPNDSKRLFEKFTRSSETMKLDVSGTGLGLYVGKNFVEAHGGLLSVESEGPSKGSTFIIKLPVEPPHPGSVTS